MNTKTVLLICLVVFSVMGMPNPGKSLPADYSNLARTIQFDVKPLLNARMVTTFSNGKLVCWNKGVDGTWSGLATRSAADLMGSKDKIALPNDGTFEANAFHPKVVLNFSDADATGNQVRFTDKNISDSYSFPVAENCYSNISLFFMSAFGSSDITVEITYSDKFITVKIKDEGEGFDPGLIPDPTNQENIFKEHGRGLFIMKSLVDKFECIPGEEGTEFILTVFRV